MELMRNVYMGISCYYHDSAVTFIEDNRILFSAQEERFTRIKNEKSFPANAIKAGMEYLKLENNNIKLVGYYENPLKKKLRTLISPMINFPRNIKEAKVYANRVGSTIINENPVDTIRTELESLGIVSRIIYVDHHKSHALSTLSTANFEEGFALVIDAVGEFTTSSLWELKSNEVKKIKSSRIPNSLGILYSTVTQYCGFKVDSGEYKLMASPYGKPKYTRELKEVVREIIYLI